MSHPAFRLTAGAAALVACAHVFAQNTSSDVPVTETVPQGPASQLSPIVVTPSRTAEPLSETLGDNSVISRDALDSMPNGTLADALERQHAITSVNYGGPQSVNTINIRGTNSNQSLVLIDGLRVNNATTGLPPLSAIPLNSIERVEIVRGASSSLYGADAIGGVVNIITRGEQDRPFSAYVNAGVGTYATSQYDAGFSGAANGWVYSLYGGYGQSGGFNSSNSSNYYYSSDNDSYYRSNAGGSLGYTWKPGQTLTFQTYQSRVNGGYDMGVPFANDRSIQTLSSNMLTSRNVINDMWTSTLRAGFSVDNYKTFGAGADLASANSPDTTQYFKTSQSQYVWQNDLKFSPTQLFTLAFERLDQNVEGNLSDDSYPTPSFVNYQQTSRYTNSVMGVYRGTWGAQSVQASVRDDNNSQYGNFVTGSLTYGLALNKEWKASVGANTGFRAPNFNELYWPITPYFMGNPLLQPEKSRNIEAGLKYTTEQTQLGIVAYRNEISNLIVNQPLFAFDPYSPYAPINIGKAIIQGVTLTGTQRFGKTTQVRGSVDFSDPRDAETNQLLPQRAQQVLKMAVDQSVGQLRLTGEWMLTSYRVDSMTGKTLGGYGLLNLYGSYPITSSADIQVRWNNVLGKTYTLVEGYNTPGSNVFVNVAWRM
jgi:vitamin B12 transporter